MAEIGKGSSIMLPAKVPICLAAIVMLSVTCVVCEAEEPREILERVLLRYQQKLPLTVSIYRKHQSEFSENWAAEPWEGQYAIDYARDTGRSDVSVQRFRSENDATISYPGEDARKIWDGIQWWDYYSPITGAIEPDGSQRLFLSNQEHYANSYEARGHLGAGLTNILYSDLRPFTEIITDAMADANSRVVAESDNGYLGVAIGTPNGTYKFFVDPLLDYQLRKIEVVKESSDLAWGRPLDYMKVSGLPQGAGRMPAVPREKLVYVLEFEGYETNLGVQVPIATHEEVLIHWENGVEELQIIETTYESYVLHPDFSNLAYFEMDIPEKTQVHLDQKVGLEFEWRNGKVEPRIDEQLLESLDASIAAAIEGIDPTPVAPQSPSALVQSAPESSTAAVSNRSMAFLAGVLLLLGAFGIAFLLSRTRRKNA